jgi:hypothetical protein
LPAEDDGARSPVTGVARLCGYTAGQTRARK